MKRAILTSIALAAVVALGLASANAETIYQDDFSGDGTASLAGIAPDVVPSGSTATWSSASTIRNNGAVNVNNSYHTNAFLPFTPEAGYVYTASLDMNIYTYSSTDNKWMVFGFVSSATPNISSNFLTSLSSYGTASYKRSADAAAASNVALKMYRGAQTANQVLGPSGLTTGEVFTNDTTHFDNFKTVLDTRTDLWKITWYLNDDEMGTSSYTSNPAITYVGFGARNAMSAAVDNFSLTYVVPEPNTFILFSMGLLGMIAYAWRKRK